MIILSLWPLFCGVCVSSSIKDKTRIYWSNKRSMWSIIFYFPQKRLWKRVFKPTSSPSNKLNMFSVKYQTLYKSNLLSRFKYTVCSKIRQSSNQWENANSQHFLHRTLRCPKRTKWSHDRNFDKDQMKTTKVTLRGGGGVFWSSQSIPLQGTGCKMASVSVWNQTATDFTRLHNQICFHSAQKLCNILKGSRPVFQEPEFCSQPGKTDPRQEKRKGE